MNLLNREILLVDKPAGMSSFAVVARVRKILTEQKRKQLSEQGGTPPKRVKVGHAGTLDPFATGLLILLLDKGGTKKAGNFLKLDKRYEATIELGKVSTTGDTEGEISEYLPYPSDSMAAASNENDPQKSTDSTLKPIPESEIQAVLDQFKGKITQTVPTYSAVKINGRRAYDLARKGIKVEMPRREVTIYDIKIMRYDWPFLTIDCKVSSGTYIRALGEDIGKALNTGGYLTALRRTEIGDYSIKEAVRLEQVLQ